MVRGRSRPQLGLQPGLPDGPTLVRFYFLFVLVLFFLGR
jgi:hypothetical protein